MVNKLYKEDIDKYRDSTHCIPKSAIKYMSGENILMDTDEGWKEKNPDGYESWEKSEIRGQGCYTSDDIDDGCSGPDHDTGLILKYKDNRLKKLCHNEDIQGPYNSLLDDPNDIVKFFKLILVSMISLLITALVASCVEFWLRYGNAVECIYYKSKCANIGKTERINLIDYLLPNSICYYPYQSCSKNKANKYQTGGSNLSNNKNGIISTFAEYEHSGAKCINLGFDPSIYGEKPIPYNIADYAINNIDSQFAIVLAKSVSFYFLFSILFARQALNSVSNKLSGYYQRFVKFNPTISNFIYLFLIHFSIPIIILVLVFASILSSIGGFVAFLATIIPKKMFGKALDGCNIPTEYYRIPTLKVFYTIDDKTDGKKILYGLLNILLCIPVLILAAISFSIGSTMNMISGFWLSITLLFNIFFIPLSNPLECFTILKSHADLLTILFCITVIGSSSLSLDRKTTGVMSMILFLIIIYKSLKGTKNSL
mgnify:CR=1 FL=1